MEDTVDIPLSKFRLFSSLVWAIMWLKAWYSKPRTETSQLCVPRRPKSWPCQQYHPFRHQTLNGCHVSER
eukprot:2769654-Amphidinium_carterae.2